MKTKNNFHLIIILIFTVFMLCSFSKNKLKTVTGYIHVYGNEPFTYIEITTDENKQYSIAASDEIISELWKTQGNKVELKGIIVQPKADYKEPEMLKDGKIELAEWRVLN